MFRVVEAEKAMWDASVARGVLITLNREPAALTDVDRMWLRKGERLLEPSTGIGGRDLSALIPALATIGAIDLSRGRTIEERLSTYGSTLERFGVNNLSPTDQPNIEEMRALFDSLNFLNEARVMR